MKFLRYVMPLLSAAVLLPASVQQLPSRTATGDGEEGIADKVPALLAALEHAENWELYEGLPSDGEGKAFLENERRTKPVLLLDDNWFYLRSQSVTQADQQKLRSLYAADIFKPWRGVKFCGGFHGDYAVSFKSGEIIHVVIFCLGCHEARILTMPAAEDLASPKMLRRLTVDLADAHYGELRTMLLKYRTNRPLSPQQKAIPMPPVPPPVPVRF